MKEIKSRVFVTGMGIVCAAGHSVEEFTSALRHGNSGIRAADQDQQARYGLTAGGFIHDFVPENQIKTFREAAEGNVKKALRCLSRAPLSIGVSAAAAFEAWNQAGLFRQPADPNRTALVVAGSNISDNYSYFQALRYNEAPEFITPSYGLHYLDTDQVGILSEIFGLHGDGFTVGGASAGGNVGIIRGYDLIQSGRADLCVVAGAMADLSPAQLGALKNLGALGGKSFADEPEKSCRPFDQKHEGFIYGQGAACLVLESEESFNARKMLPLAEIAGGAVVLDGNRLSNPSKQGESRAMTLALETLAENADSVDYINAHGTSTPMGDDVELDAISEVFGSANLQRVWINSTKSITGHCLYSAGTVETAAIIAQMRGEFIHPNVNLENPTADGFRFAGNSSVQTQIKCALNNSFGFGGINASVIIRNV